jgi:hypothetical protein
VLTVEWENVHLAGAFVLGAVLGALATIRIMRAVLQTFNRYGPRRNANEPPPAEADGGSNG